ncbi:hypothetical protein, partial [Helicobacter rodentium]
MDSTNGIFKTIQLQPCHCEAKPKQSIIKHTEILTMESKKARFHIVDCHESRCDSRNDEIANFL